MKAASLAVSRESLLSAMERSFSRSEPFVIAVTGNSMAPYLVHLRDRVVLEPCRASDLVRGDVALYRREGGQVVLHRVYRKKHGLYTMIGDAQWTLEPGIRPDQILARAASVIRNGVRMPAGRGKWRVWMEIYLMRMLAPRLSRGLKRLGWDAPRAALKKRRGIRSVDG